jgi:hypothetical protein
MTALRPDEVCSMLRLLLLFYGIASLINAAPAHACSFDRLSDEQLFARASTVLVAHVVRTEEALGLSPLSDKPEVIVEASFRVIEVLKGPLPTDGKVKSFMPRNGNCSVLLLPATDYLFFLNNDLNFVEISDGSRPIFLEGAEIVVSETKILLQRLRAISK